MKRIGLVTIHAIANCGSLLQTWATVRAVEKLGCRCEVIDYDYPTWWHVTHARGDENRGEAYASVKRLLAALGFLRLAKRMNFWRRRRATLRAISGFLRKLPLTARHYDRRSVAQAGPYDVYLTGSDQTWNPRYLGTDFSFLLDFASHGARRVSYAASFGCNELPAEFRAAYAARLRAYDAISVRERSGEAIVSDLTGRSAETVLDPTLLLAEDDYLPIIANKIPEGRRFVFAYVLSYVFDPGDWTIELIKRLSCKYHAEVYLHCDHVLMKRRAEAAGFRVHKGFMPAEDFLENVSKAVFVVTTSFHGTAFSINFGKDFYSILNPNRTKDNRVAALLESVGLESRGLVPGASTDALTTSTDYSCAAGRLSELRQRSVDYLKRALSDI